MAPAGDTSPPARERNRRSVLAAVWFATLVAIGAIRIASPPQHGINRRIEFSEVVDLLLGLSSVPLVAAAVVTTIAWVKWRRGWWLYQLTLLGMTAAVIYCVAMANWQDGQRWADYPAGHPSAPGQLEFHWHPLVIWSLVARQWAAALVSFEAFLAMLGLAAVAPSIAGFFRSRRRRTVESR